MSQGVTRIPVLPRAVAARVTVFAVARGCWAIAVVSIVVALIGIGDQLVRLGYARDVFAPVGALIVMLGALLVLALRPSWVTMAGYLVIGGICEYVFLHGVMDAHADLLPALLVLVNRPATALVLMGTVGRRPLPAIAWGVAGFLVGEGVTALVCLQVGTPLYFGNGPTITLVNYCAAFIGLALIQRAQRGRIPDFLRFARESRSIDRAITIEQHQIALLHDTVLNDLALVINGPDELDERARARMLEDVATLSNPTILHSLVPEDVIDSADTSLRNQALAVVSEFQWRGLSVEVTGDTGRVVHMTSEAVAAAIGSLRACLENVLKHSGSTTAEIVIAVSDRFATWTVADGGRGFDVGSIADDRLGLKSSVIRRVEAAGGSVRIFSSVESGTSVLFTLPLLDAPESQGPDGSVQ